MKPLRWLLYPIAVLYGLITGLRNLAYNKGWLKTTRFALPVICVGNLSVGGTGKTPHIEYLIRLLEAKGALATLSRGYGRKTSGYLLADETSTSEVIGDEPRQFKQKFPGISVAVDEDRAHGINTLINGNTPPAVVLLDDAYQHRSVQAGFNVLLTTYEQPYWRDVMLPTGNMREYRCGARRADAIIITKCPAGLSEAEQSALVAKVNRKPQQQVYCSYFRYGNPVAMGGQAAITLAALQAGNYHIVLLTGIATAEPLVELLKPHSGGFEHVRFPDHHQYTASDLERVQKIIDNFAGHQTVVITTEKDAMRLTSNSIAHLTDVLPIYYIPIQVAFHGDGSEKFNAQILAYASGANEGNGSVSQG